MDFQQYGTAILSSVGRRRTSDDKVGDEEESDIDNDKMNKLKQNFGRPLGSAMRGSFKESDLEMDDENNPEAMIKQYKEDQFRLMHEGGECRKECCDPIRKIKLENDMKQHRRKKVHETAKDLVKAWQIRMLKLIEM